jgi:hypothetical protein
MSARKNILRLLTWAGVILLQLILTQVVTLLFSLIIPSLENFPQSRPGIFVIVVGISFTVGVFLGGWLALKRRWLTVKPKYASRLVATVIGAYLPLIAALLIYHPLEPGNPFFFVSILSSILGFHLPGWIEANAAFQLREVLLRFKSVLAYRR